jgi:glycerophosphoryl diester phosphodiesterase
MRFFLIFIAALLTTACTMEQSEPFDLQGHRGARGLLPENTIPGFLKAAELRVTTVEFDVVVTADNKILVSHEPWFHHHISSKPDGSPVTEEEQMSFNIYEMTYEETRRFDVGKRGNPNHPRQEPMEVTKPLMKDAIRAIDNFTEENGLPPVHFSIETKSRPEWYGEMVPGPEEFARLMHAELSELDVLDRTIIQSFDPSTLIAFRQLAPDVRQAMLVNQPVPEEVYLDLLGYTPEIWSPDFNLLSPQRVQQLQGRGMRVIPWTVNDTSEMRALIDMGVDGLITDYPDSAAVLLREMH